jgi:hypothetical protein
MPVGRPRGSVRLPGLATHAPSTFTRHEQSHCIHSIGKQRQMRALSYAVVQREPRSAPALHAAAEATFLVADFPRNARARLDRILFNVTKSSIGGGTHIVSPAALGQQRFTRSPPRVTYSLSGHPASNVCSSYSEERPCQRVPGGRVLDDRPAPSIVLLEHV